MRDHIRSVNATKHPQTDMSGDDLAPSDAYEDVEPQEVEGELTEYRAIVPKGPCRRRDRSEFRTANIMTRFELVRVLAERAKMIEKMMPVIRSVYKEVAINQLAAKWDLDPALVAKMVDRTLESGTRLLIKELRDHLASELTDEVVRELSSQYNVDSELVRESVNNLIGRKYWSLRTQVYEDLLRLGHVAKRSRSGAIVPPPTVRKGAEAPLYLTPKDVARLELKRGLIPISIIRNLSDNTCEIWNANELRPAHPE